MSPSSAIGLFDSGIGGLTIMQELVQLLPHERLIYFADTAHLPYGNLSPDAVIRFSVEGAQFLARQNIKLLIIACHTVCVHAIEILQDLVPILGVTAVALVDLIAASPSKRVAVLATRATIASGVFQRALQSQGVEVYPLACPLFVPLIEQGLQDHPMIDWIIERQLAPLQGKDIDAALFACTHYPLLTAKIQHVLGPAVQLVDPARSLALQVYQELESRHLLNPSSSIPEHIFFVSADPAKFQRLANRFSVCREVQLAKNKIL